MLNQALPDVTLGVLTHNSVSDLVHLFKSLINLENAKQLELLLVDNASKDDTLSLLQNFEKEFSQQFYDVKVIFNPINNIAMARDIVLKNSTSDLVAYIDSDCRFPHNWVQKIIEGLQQSQEFSSSAVAFSGSQTHPDTNQFYKAINLTKESFLGHGGSPQAKLFDKIKEVDHAPCTNVVFIKSALLEINGFDPRFALCGEDRDICLRIRKAGYKVFMGPEPIVINDCADHMLSWLERIFRFGRVQPKLLGGITPFQPFKFHIPTLLALFVTLVLLVSIFFNSNFLMYFALFYALMVLSETARLCAIKKQTAFLILPYLFIGTHIAYFAGFVIGLVEEVILLCFAQRMDFSKGVGANRIRTPSDAAFKNDFSVKSPPSCS